MFKYIILNKSNRMIYLQVTYDQKDIAKGLGARWDPEKKLWYAPDNSYQNLLETFNSFDSKLNPHDNSKSTEKKPKVTIQKQSNYIKLIGENKDFRKGELYIDLIPKNTNFSLYNNLSKDIYYRLKDTLIKINAYKCEVCDLDCSNNSGNSLYLCERFSYDIENKIQKLERISVLCNNCMTTTRLKNKEIALEHLQNILDISKEEAKNLIYHSFEIWKKHCQIQWNLDLSLLTNSQIKIEKLDIQENEKQNEIKQIKINNSSNKESTTNSNEIKKISIQKFEKCLF